ncbi:MAG: hypothetical protein IIA83_00055 [Thaumarchaeota archaeon]|nr:hypothetical protein [Nitrososphaerota archaeon]
MLSRDSVFSGKFDKVTSKIKSSLPVKTPDEFFLEQINKWRKSIAQNLIKKDPSLTDEEINDMVQLLINRIIFLRICEDRTIEPPKTLLDSTKTFDKKKFVTTLKNAVKKYDSDLFDTHELPIEFDSSNKELFEIIEELYYPKSPFSFRVIESSLLGDVYEMFLTEKIQVVPGSTPKIKLVKKSKEKDRDIISTPSFIIQKIVQDSIAKRCDSLTPKKIQKIRILDPACGSGSFLVTVFQFLIDYVINWYEKNGHNGEIYQTVGVSKLAIKEKIKILECIYGIDIDFNAVEVTKFSLCIKLLEDETKITLESMKNILPKLSKNILCGNSVVDSVIWKSIKKKSLKPKEIEAVNVFDWKKQFTKTTFDIIIGNPSYMMTGDMKKYINPQWTFFKKQYTVSDGQFDEYYVFIQKCYDQLAKKG